MRDVPSVALAIDEPLRLPVSVLALSRARLRNARNDAQMTVCYMLRDRQVQARPVEPRSRIMRTANSWL